MDARVSRLISEFEEVNESLLQEAESRHQLSKAARKLLLTLESPLETVRRIAFSVSM